MHGTDHQGCGRTTRCLSVQTLLIMRKTRKTKDVKLDIVQYLDTNPVIPFFFLFVNFVDTQGSTPPTLRLCSHLLFFLVYDLFGFVMVGYIPVILFPLFLHIDFRQNQRREPRRFCRLDTLSIRLIMYRRVLGGHDFDLEGVFDSDLSDQPGFGTWGSTPYPSREPDMGAEGLRAILRTGSFSFLEGDSLACSPLWTAPHVPECANNATNSIHRRDISIYFILSPSFPLSLFLSLLSDIKSTPHFRG